jgi:hypothetical protein
MDGQNEQPREGPAGPPPRPLGPIGLSRRQFTRNVGAGGVAAVGLMWAGPKISTIRYAAKAAAGSPPPTTTTSTTGPGVPEGTISVNTRSPCAGDSFQLHASGFVQKTAVTIELDSAAHILGTTTSNGDGRINVRVDLAPDGPTGEHTLKVIGVRPGGQTLTLSVPLVIKTVAECETQSEGSTTTSPTTVPASTPTTTPTVTTAPQKPQQPQQQQGGESLQHGGGVLAFTGANSSELALVGGAAALAGWAVYGIASDREGGDDDVDSPPGPA